MRRLDSAIAILEGIQTSHEKRSDVNNFLQKNIDYLGSLFQLIHSPREFSKIVWNADEGGIRAIRTRGGTLSGVSSMSSGQRNALSLSIFLTMNRNATLAPPFVLLDDPLAHVDDMNVVSFLDCLREIVQGSGKQIVFTAASSKTAYLFRKKFEHLGDAGYAEYLLES
jgi:ABC-type cobalamin/Fe3+-siderophores transport system ATPase subunit